MKKRPLLDRFLVAASMKKKMQQEENKRMEKIFRTAKIGGIILIILNTFLLTDVFLLPLQETDDKIDHVSIIKTYRKRSGQTSTVDYYLITQQGRRIALSRDYPENNHRLKITLTPITRMVIQVKDIDAGVEIEKAYNPFTLVIYFSPLLFLFGVLSLFIRKTMQTNAVVSILYIGAALVQLVTFLI